MRSRESRLFYLLVAIFTSLFVTPTFAQNAADEVKVRLSLPGGKISYRIGEPIRMALTFTSDADGYQLNITTTKPASPVDEILMTPEEGVSNWLEEYSGRHRYSPDYMSTQKITTAPTIVELPLNDCFRFDRPGKYTVQVKTSRVSRAEPRGSGQTIRLMTNEVSFEVIAMSNAEEEQEVRRLSALLDATRDRKEEARISEELSYLTGESSTREKARRYTTSPGPSGNSVQNIHLGLFIARDRALVVRQLEAALRDPNTPVTHQLLHTLPRLRLLQEGIEHPGIAAGLVVEGDQGQHRSLEILEEKINLLKQSCVTKACRQHFHIQ